VRVILGTREDPLRLHQLAGTAHLVTRMHDAFR